MAPRRYIYVGPADVREAASASPPGVVIENPASLTAWFERHVEDMTTEGTITATFVVDADGLLRLARAPLGTRGLSSGGPVLSAGEITFSKGGDVTEITNQSTGFCPEPESWPSVAAVLYRIPLSHPGRFTTGVAISGLPELRRA